MHANMHRHTKYLLHDRQGGFLPELDPLDLALVCDPADREGLFTTGKHQHFMTRPVPRSEYRADKGVANPIMDSVVSIAYQRDDMKVLRAHGAAGGNWALCCAATANA